MRVLVSHRSVYRYPRPAALGPHQLRLRPANHARARLETYALRVSGQAELRWQQDPSGNHVAQVAFPKDTRLAELAVEVELALDVRPVNPFDFFLDARCEELPFAYPAELAPELAPYLDRADPAHGGGARFEAFLETLPSRGGTVATLVALNEAVTRRVRYVVREEPGIWTPEETLAHGQGSCRDSAVLLVAALRARGLAARFVSGYLVQLADEGMIPDAPRGVTRDVVDLHAWAEVFLPGGGWIGLDATSGLLCGEGHVPLACVARPALGAPIVGTSDVPAEDVRFELAVVRLGHEPRPTAPFTDETWEALLAAGDRADAALDAAGLALTLGGEPAFTSREHPEQPEWRGEALGPTKRAQAQRLAEALRDRLAPGGLLLTRTGKTYPGEPLPRWALDICGRRDGVPLWGSAEAALASPAGPDAAAALARAIATRLGLDPAAVQPAYEDPFRLVKDEADLPVPPLAPAAGSVLPLAREGKAWQTERWSFRRGRLFLVPGDSPVGLRLPLSSLGGPPEPHEPAAHAKLPPDPRVRAAERARKRAEAEALARRARKGLPAPPPPAPPRAAVRTALCVEPRGGSLAVFLPPLATAADFVALVGAVDGARRALGLRVELEGYPPPWDAELLRFGVAPDPGVLEVNIPPTRTARAYAALVGEVFDAALHAGLTAETWLLDGRQAGPGGGNHVTAGGPTAVESPFVRRPALLASLVTFLQHHPSLAYLFTGLFVGPTSQAPRVDEARHDALYELEIALRALFDAPDPAPPWLADSLLRHLLVDVSGNGHRTELCIDKLFDWRTPHGRQGLVELRAFEMPPHPRLAVAQGLLVRGIVAALAAAPYRHALVRHGTALHDRFLLPTWLWRDLEDVLEALAERGVVLPPDAYRPFLELRCPVAGRLEAGGVVLEVRNALEPWPVLGEEPGASGTTRFVDSSTERIEVRAEGLDPERWAVLVNGITLPLRPAGVRGALAGGVRFRAWAPAHALQPHLGVHHPLRIDLWDRWGSRSAGACAYHVWHPEGRAYDAPPLTRFEAAARRAQRFTVEGPLPRGTIPRAPAPHPEFPTTLDLRRFGGDRPLPALEEDP